MASIKADLKLTRRADFWYQIFWPAARCSTLWRLTSRNQSSKLVRSRDHLSLMRQTHTRTRDTLRYELIRIEPLSYTVQAKPYRNSAHQNRVIKWFVQNTGSFAMVLHQQSTFFLFPVDKTTNVDVEKFFKMKAWEIGSCNNVSSLSFDDTNETLKIVNKNLV